jgi:shikimate dehydrogenase
MARNYAMVEQKTSPALYAVMGNPISHSKSPEIHRQFANQFKHDIDYTAIEVATGGFARAVEEFRARDGLGLNVTVPFKLDAYWTATERSDRAELAGAVNTLEFKADGSVFGDNTDGAGLVHDLTKNIGINLKDKRILVMGAGGAVRGVLCPLLKQNPAVIVLANRTVRKAKELAKLFSSYGKLEPCGYDALKGRHFEVVINGTSAGLQGEVPPLPANLLKGESLAYDMLYGDMPTPFMDWALQVGAKKIYDGLGMLVEQAAESYFIWHGVRPDTKPVLAGLRKMI